MSANAIQNVTMTEEMERLIQSEKDHQKQTRLENLALARKALADKKRREEDAKKSQNIQSSLNTVKNQSIEERSTKRPRDDIIVDEIHQEEIEEIKKYHGGENKKYKRQDAANYSLRDKFFESIARTIISVGITYGVAYLYKQCIGGGLSNYFRSNNPSSNGNELHFNEFSPQLENHDHFYHGQSIFK